MAEQRRIQPASSRSFRPEEDYDYVELEERREREPLRQRRYLDDEEPRSWPEERDSERRRETRPFEEAGYGQPRRPTERPDDRAFEVGWGGRRAVDQESFDSEPPFRPQAESPAPRREPSVRDLRGEERSVMSYPNPEPSMDAPRTLDRSSPEGRFGEPPVPRARDQARGADRSRQQPVDVEAEPIDDPW